MNEIDGYKEVKGFVQRGVTIFAPDGSPNGINARENDLLWKPNMRTVEPDFKPHRPVIDLGINNPGAQDSTKSGRKLILRVYFTHDDQKNILNIKLAYWKNDKWTVFTEIVDGRKQIIKGKLLPDNQIWAGYFDVEIDSWIDPPIAVGS